MHQRTMNRNHWTENHGRNIHLKFQVNLVHSFWAINSQSWLRLVLFLFLFFLFSLVKCYARKMLFRILVRISFVGRGTRRLIATELCKFCLFYLFVCIFSWDELNWIELNWIELNWIELNWIELSWVILSWVILNWVISLL